MATMHAAIGCADDRAGRVSPAEFTSTALRLPGAAAFGGPDVSVGNRTASQDHNSSGTPAGSASLHDDWEPEAAPRRWRYIVLHHTATEEGDLATIDAEHRRRKDRQGNAWLGIGYHFLIGNGQGMPNGAVEPTFRWKQQLHGAHAGDRDYNEQGIGISLVGNFDEHPPTARQVQAARDLVRWLVERYDIEPQRIVCHQDVGATRCPGKQFPFHDILGSQPPVDIDSSR